MIACPFGETFYYFCKILIVVVAYVMRENVRYENDFCARRFLQCYKQGSHAILGVLGGSSKLAHGKWAQVDRNGVFPSFRMVGEADSEDGVGHEDYIVFNAYTAQIVYAFLLSGDDAIRGVEVSLIIIDSFFVRAKGANGCPVDNKFLSATFDVISKLNKRRVVFVVCLRPLVFWNSIDVSSDGDDDIIVVDDVRVVKAGESVLGTQFL